MTTAEIEKTMANRLEEMREERDEIAAAADRNAAKFTKIARLNREYIEQIKLKDELIESLTKASHDNNEAAAAKNKQLGEKVQALTDELAEKTMKENGLEFKRQIKDYIAGFLLNKNDENYRHLVNRVASNVQCVAVELNKCTLDEEIKNMVSKYCHKYMLSTYKELVSPPAPSEPKKARRMVVHDVDKIAYQLSHKKLDEYYQTQLKDQKKQYENKIRETKKINWCAVCFKEARYYCCWTAFYCTPECQRSHWGRGHSSVCTNARPNQMDNESPNQDNPMSTNKELVSPPAPSKPKKARRMDAPDVGKIRRDKRKKWDKYYRKQLEDQEKKYEKKIRETKKRQWCAICFKEARCFCCSAAFYCSKTSECQRIHWTMGHSAGSAKPNGQQITEYCPA